MAFVTRISAVRLISIEMASIMYCGLLLRVRAVYSELVRFGMCYLSASAQSSQGLICMPHVTYRASAQPDQDLSHELPYAYIMYTGAA